MMVTGCALFLSAMREMKSVVPLRVMLNACELFCLPLNRQVDGGSKSTHKSQQLFLVMGKRGSKIPTG